jgi:hypothetical protein
LAKPSNPADEEKFAPLRNASIPCITLCPRESSGCGCFFKTLSLRERAG